MPRLAVLILVGTLAGIAVAQNRMMAGTHSPAGRAATAPQQGHVAGWRITAGHNVDHRGSGRPYRGSGLLGYGWPYFYDDYAESYGPEPAQAPASAPAAPVQVKAEPIPSPALLELRGDQWVRVDNFTTSPALAPNQPLTSTPAAADSAPAVVIYRDGHSEELSSYSIIDAVIYAKGDYWASGSWTRKIQIADLDVPATLKQNQNRGVKFDLPSGPNEVIIRP